MKKTVFREANILLPAYESTSPLWEKWAVIACDQFTSQIEYWSNAERISEGELSTLKFILPEAYLETEKAAPHKAAISDRIRKSLPRLIEYKDTLVYLERTLPTGDVRRGIVGKIDLEQYDFRAGTNPMISATEETVLERIPPRVEVRRDAIVELPHVMVFYDDKENTIVNYIESIKATLTVLYDFELMLGGGRVRGYKIDGEALSGVLELIAAYEKNNTYAVGDGNHSLASAKTYYDEIKNVPGREVEAYKARYALCEMVNIEEESIVFEPIYRIVKNVNVDDISGRFSDSGVKVTAVIGEEKREVVVPKTHETTLGSLQNFIDEYLLENPIASCDYIHGEDAVFELAKNENTVGFLCEGIEKDALIPYVAKNGALPRKTFSMGEAKSKRYYIEARRIK